MKGQLNHTSKLTKSQLLLWTGQELNPDSPLYNMALSFEIRGAINQELFCKAFQQLVDQSDAMRTTFRVVNGVPVQQIHHQFDYPLEILDWSNQPNPSRLLDDWVRTASQQLFDLEVSGFHSVLIKLGEERYVWYLNQHHLITDAWGVSVQYQTMVQLYEAAVKDFKDVNPNLPLFQKYIEFEQKSQLDPANEDSRNYWSDKSKELPPTPKLYGHNFPTNTTRSNRVSLNLGRDRSDKLRALSQQDDLKAWTQELSLFNIFATVLFAYLHRISGEQILSIGTPAHNRPTPEFKKTPGVFIELFPLVSKINDQDSFTDLFQQLRLETNNLLKHARAGVTTTKLTRNFHVILNFIHAAFSDFGGIPMTSQWIHSGHADPRHFLRLQVHDFDASGNIQLYFDLNEEVFDPKQLKTVPDHFLSILDAFIEDRTQRIDAIPIITSAEQEELLHINNPITSGMSNTVPGLFKTVADSNPSATAVRQENVTLNFKELDEKSNQLAHYLMNRGIGQGNVVAIYMKRSVELIIGILGVMKSGATYLPIAPINPADRVKLILKDSAASLTIHNLGFTFPDSKSDSLELDEKCSQIQSYPKSTPTVKHDPHDNAYIMYTSGSTGLPKGVCISHQGLTNYLLWAKSVYVGEESVHDRLSMPLFTLISFDLTVTSLFLPLITGGCVVVYPETSYGPDMTLLQVIEDNLVNAIKLTPSHLALVTDKPLKNSNIQLLIVGGEDFKTSTASKAVETFGNQVRIINEYGPTEATVGCIYHEFTSEDAAYPSVPIGKPIYNMQAYVLDNSHNLVPRGVTGKLYLSGTGVLKEYLNQPEYTASKLVSNPFNRSSVMYDTGDLVRIDKNNRLNYVGRKDHQVQIGGMRVELGEIETILNQHPQITSSAVVLQSAKAPMEEEHVQNCTRCGLPSNYPSVTFDQQGVCDLCRSFETYQQKAQKYFKSMKDLEEIFKMNSGTKKGEYDCMMLLSGGKDSTYALARLAELGVKVLAFTLDNGYISDQAKANIKRVVQALNVDHIFGETKAMNAIFVDSLKRHANVCNGCFKTIYSLSAKIALEKNIPIIVTGLSRGQFFETRLTEELFKKPEVNFDRIDQTILEARKVYHRTNDAVNQLLDVSFFKDDEVFNQIRYVDFYRYCDVSLSDMYSYLDEKLPWVRPSDTGRSTNCLINQAGIYVHKKMRGYSNYAFPYSWDVRMGHKTRAASLEEINEVIEEPEVHKMLDEIGFSLEDSYPERQQLIAYYSSGDKLSPTEIKEYLAKELPGYMIPSQTIAIDKIPLTPGGKIDREALPDWEANITKRATEIKYPETQVEKMLFDIWSEVLQISNLSIEDNFLDIGGNSLQAIRVMARVNESFGLDLTLTSIFQYPTIQGFGRYIEETIDRLLDAS